MNIRFADPETGKFTKTELKIDHTKQEKVELLGFAGEEIKRGDMLMFDRETGYIMRIR